MFFAFLISMMKSGVLITIGIFMIKHMYSFISWLSGKEMPDDKFLYEKIRAAMQVIVSIGWFVLLMGICVGIVGVLSFAASLGIPS